MLIRWNWKAQTQYCQNTLLESKGAVVSEPEGTPENTAPVSSLSTWETGPGRKEAWSPSKSLEKQGGSFQGAVASVGCVTPSLLHNLSGPRTGSLPCPGPCLSLGCYNRLRGLNDKYFFRTSFGFSRSRFHQIQCLMRTCFLGPFLLYPSAVERKMESSLGSLL